VARQVANDGKAVYRAEQIDGTLAAQQSIVDLRLSSVACMPLSWLSPESDVPTVNGVLYLDSTRRMRVLSQFDQKILNKLAVEAASVFEKLELVRTFEQRKSLELDLELAQRELHAADALRHAESRVLLAEYGASMGRFAAALSHELNSPIGALKTALQAGAVLAEKKAALPAEKRADLEKMETQLRDTAIESLERLHQIVLRMQRFTNLDRSEILPVDLNLLLQDVVDIFKAEIKEDAHVELDLKPLPVIWARPQQLSAVFANLLENATEELDVGGHVRLSTHQIESQVEITIEDDGRGLPAEELANIFDPAFKVKSGRISTGNWSLFSSRQIVWEHGGEIELQSAPGRGTTVRVKLPCSENT
jgi:signal transduction histidine kinase